MNERSAPETSIASDPTLTVAQKASTFAKTFAADPRDRFLAPIDPLLRNAKRRFGTIIVFACLLHVVILILLLVRDHATAPALQETQIPVEVIIEPPPPKPLQKEQQKPQPKEKEKVLKDEVARDVAPPPNDEKLRTQPTDKASTSPLQNKPIPNADLKPVPNPQTQASKSATQPAERTVAPNETQDKPDAEPLDKAAPIKDQKAEEKQKPSKDKSPLPNSEKAALAREFAALTPAPKFAVATEAKPSPINGGQCHATPYLCTLFGLIMRKQHYPEEARAQHIEGTVVVAFWVDERGDLVHQALYRTSGHPILDDEAVASIRRAAPFPPPPPGIPHGFIAQMEFPPK
ncbi:MAG: TonB family protein [Methylovirgula sp.]